MSVQEKKNKNLKSNSDNSTLEMKCRQWETGPITGDAKMSYHLNISKLLLFITPQEESVSHFITTRMINLFGTEVQNVEFF